MIGNIVITYINPFLATITTNNIQFFSIKYNRISDSTCLFSSQTTHVLYFCGHSWRFPENEHKLCEREALGFTVKAICSQLAYLTKYNEIQNGETFNFMNTHIQIYRSLIMTKSIEWSQLYSQKKWNFIHRKSTLVNCVYFNKNNNRNNNNKQPPSYLHPFIQPAPFILLHSNGNANLIVFEIRAEKKLITKKNRQMIINVEKR